MGRADHAFRTTERAVRQWFGSPSAANTKPPAVDTPAGYTAANWKPGAEQHVDEDAEPAAPRTYDPSLWKDAFSIGGSDGFQAESVGSSRAARKTKAKPTEK